MRVPWSKASRIAPAAQPRLLRDDTPGALHVLHLNNAGAALSPRPVIEAFTKFSELETQIGGYEAAEAQLGRQMLDLPYTALSQLLNCTPESIAIGSSATAAWQRIFLGIPLWRPGSRIITTSVEYGSNFIAFLQAQKRFGTAIHVLRDTPAGDLDLSHLQELLAAPPAYTRESAGSVAGAGDMRGPPVTLVAVTHVPTSSGRVCDAAGVGAVVRPHPGVWYVLDACQSAGQMPLDVRAIGCHFLTATGRKFLRAPRGCGFLYASPEALRVLEPGCCDVRGGSWRSRDAYELQPSARRYEEYEMSFASKAGLGAAARYCLEVGPEFVWREVQQRADILRAGLAAIERVAVADHGRQLCGIVSFTVEGMEAGAVKEALHNTRGPRHPEGINVSVSSAPSTRLDFDRRQLDHVVRASPHYYNSCEDMEIFVEAVRLIVSWSALKGKK